MDDTWERGLPGELADDVENGRPGSEPLLDVRNLKTWFVTDRGVVHAVDGVSFSLERGKTLGVVGESGSGKTVLSRSIAGLLQSQRVTRRGQVIFDGREISQLSERALCKILGAEIGVVLQDPMASLHPMMKIGSQLAESLRLHRNVSRSEARDETIDLLRDVRIPEPERRVRQYPHELSGGMRQRVVLAIAMACNPKLLLADEPTTALDVTVQAQLLDLLKQKQEQRGMAMILVSHDLGVVATRTDEVAVMYSGRVVEKAKTETLLSNARMPYTEALLKSAPRLDQPSGTPLEVIEGRPPDMLNPPPGCRFAPRCPYVQERCLLEDPPLQALSADPDHWFACWYPVGTPAGNAALQRNRSHATAHANAAPAQREV